MRSSLVVRGVTIEWDPERRVFDYRAGPPGPAREDEERLAVWLRERAGMVLPYGLLVERVGSVSGTRVSGFSVAEMLKEGRRVHIACIGLTQTERLMLPVLTALTGVNMESFATRVEAQRWLDQGLSRRTSSTATR